MERKRQATFIISTIVAVVLVYLAIQNLETASTVLSWAVGVLSPILLGVVGAMVLNVPMTFLEKQLFAKSKFIWVRKHRRALSISTSLLFILGILAGVIGLIIPELIKAIRVVAERGIELIGELEQSEHPLLANIQFGDMLTTLQDWMKEKSGTIVKTIGSLIGGVVQVVFGIVFAIYILVNKETLKYQVRRVTKAWLPYDAAKKLIHSSDVIRIHFKNFVTGQSLEALILGSLCTVGMFILGIPYAPTVGVFVGVTALIPIVGAFVAAIGGAFIIFTDSPVKALIFLIFLIVLQQIEGNIIYPKVMGSRVNLPPMWILAAVTLGGGVAGPVGMLLGVPIFSSFYQLFKEATIQKEQKKHK